MKIDVTQHILALNGQAAGTLPQACTQVLDVVMRGDEALDGPAKRHLAKLAITIQDEDQPDLAIEDWAKIKERCERAYAPVMVLRISELLDPPSQIKAVAEG